MSFSLRVPAGHFAEVQWIASVVFRDRLGLDVEISEHQDGDFVLEHADRTLAIRNDYFARCSQDSNQPAIAPGVPPGDWRITSDELSLDPAVRSVPVLFGAPGFRMESDTRARLELDVLGSAFYMLSRVEETAAVDRDAHDRFPATASLAHERGCLDRPVVDEYVEILRSAIERLWPGARCRRGEFAVSLSHDIDSPSFYGFTPWQRLLRRAAGDCLKRGQFGRAVKDIRMRLGSRYEIRRDDPYNTFDWIMEQSERFGMSSTFFVICGGNHPTFDAEYDIGHKAIRGLLKRIDRRGHSIGLHASYDTYLSSARLAAESKRLRDVCAEEEIELGRLHSRMHYLRMRVPDTLRNLQYAGIDADASLTFADHAGFRCGTCFEYPAFDPVARERLDIAIRPLIAMESSIMDERYMGLGISEAAADTLISLKSACRRVGGVFSLLWHNTQLVTDEQRELYGSVLAA